MVMTQSDLLNSYEKDFADCMVILSQAVEDSDPMIEKNKFVLKDTEQLLKQIDVEAMNFMGDDVIRKRITKHKADYDKVRKQIRKIQ